MILSIYWSVISSIHYPSRIGWRMVISTLQGNEVSNAPRHPSDPISAEPFHALTKVLGSAGGYQCVHQNRLYSPATSGWWCRLGYFFRPPLWCGLFCSYFEIVINSKQTSLMIGGYRKCFRMMYLIYKSCTDYTQSLLHNRKNARMLAHRPIILKQNSIRIAYMYT